MLRHFVPCVLLLATLLGCSTTRSSGSQGDGQVPHVLTLIDHRNGLRMALISDSWLLDKGMPGTNFVERRASYYSQKMSNENLNVKVIDDASAKGMWEVFQDSGFQSYGKSGAAPGPGGQALGVLEMQFKDGAKHMFSYSGMGPDETKSFLECKKIFLTVYNTVLQLQSVDKMPEFQSPRLGSQR